MPAPTDPIEIDPVELQEDLKDRMQRYLMTALPIHRRFPKLRDQAAAELSRSANLVKGPYLEALPDYPKGRSLEDLVDQGMLHKGFAEFDPEVYQRPLHVHQEEALINILNENKNVVVATGTGSGKTECFLYPLIDTLLKSNVSGKPGIRAILVYPLNALANDQLYRRIVPTIAKELQDYGLTVGRYTGQTTPGKSRQHFEEQSLQDPFMRGLFGNSIPKNWLLSRDEMLDTPPHVLVTNYAMLEHLLLLPRNAPLFNGAHLEFLVLDEIHTYAGAQATEVAFLLRKLRNRYAPGKEVRCIGTSASLGASKEVKGRVLEFAGRLFGFPFSEVISATREPYHLLSHGKPTTRLKPNDWIRLHRILQDVRNIDQEDVRRDKWNDMAMEANIDLLVENEDTKLSALLCRSLAKDETVRNASSVLAEEGLQSLTDLSVRLFPDAKNPEEAQSALTGMIALGAYAREYEETFPLLPARYHLFARGVEEATIELEHPGRSDEHASNLLFKRVFQNPDTGKPRFRLLTCRKCGELYFEAYEKAQKIAPEHGGRGWKRSVFWLKPKDSFVLPSDLSEAQADEQKTPDAVHIHVESGSLKEILDDEDDPTEWILTHRAKMRKPTNEDLDNNQAAVARVNTCHSCGASEANEIVTPFHPGDQALSATICEVLYSHLPTSKNSAERYKKPGRGRNLLVFSDNRQDAAFFAPYFQRSHEDLMVRRAIVQHLKENGKARLHGLSEDLDDHKYLLKGGVTNRDGDLATSADLSTVIRGKVFSEFCTPGGSRVSLEDMGLVVVEYDGVDLNELGERTKLPEKSRGTLIRWILDTIRLNRAITMPGEIRADDDFVWGLYAQSDRHYTLELDDPKARFRFLPRRRNDGSVFMNRYVDVLRDKQMIENWEEVLREIWGAIKEDDDGEGLLRNQSAGSPLHLLDHRYLSVRLRRNDEPLFRCNKCSKITTYVLGTKCVQWRCTGEPEVVDQKRWSKELERNHYHFMYAVLDDLPSVIAREHTAAISTGLREDIENRFKNGRVNLLSSSTTMEMGIDLGDLEGVFLRNVPPDISNYQQRAGRAGRRAQAAPVSITYSRNRRYDQDVFQRSEEYLRKEPRTPFVHLGNDRLFQRHQFSILICHYLAHQGLTDTGIQIGQLFGIPKFNLEGNALVPETGGHPSFTSSDEDRFVDRLSIWLNSADATKAKTLSLDLLKSLETLLQEHELEKLRATTNTLDAAFIESMTRLANTFGERFRHYMEMAEELNQSGKSGVDSMRNRAYRWANQPIINFLSKYGLIPTYSFPVDSIELEVIQGKYNRSKEIELSRDARLGIREYAPGAEVIANGRVWISRAISQHPREFMPPFHYKICQNCRHIEAWEDRSLIPGLCSSCGAELGSETRRFIEPRGFTTAVGESFGKEPGSSRETPPSTMETQLIGNAPDHKFQGGDLMTVEWALQDAQSGRMVVINQGRGHGFGKCSCGYSHAFTPNKRKVEKHKNPYTDMECKTEPSSYKFDLAHTFHTDVLQIRCKTRIPEPIIQPANPTDDEIRLIKEKVARSITEAVRLACCELAEIPENEISATYRWLPDQGLEIIIFDNVPGGAGYSGSVYRKNVSELFQCARSRILECPDNCSSSCSKCLRSYSNQQYWDDFRRLEAIDWMEDVLSIRRSDPRVELGAKIIKPEYVSDLCDKADHIIILRNRFGEFTGAIDADERGRERAIDHIYPEWSRINRWLASDKKVTIICRQLPQFKDTSLPKARRLAEVLLPYVRSGKLRLAASSIEESNSQTDNPDLIIQGKGADNAVFIYEADRSREVLDLLWTDNILSREVPLSQLKDYENPAGLITPDELEKPESITRIQYRPGQARNLESDFSFIGQGSVDRIEVTDRYMAASESNKRSVSDFMDLVAGIWKAPPREIVFNLGPAGNQSDRTVWMSSIDEVIKKLKKDPRFADVKIDRVFRGYGNVRNFHDRRIKAVFGVSDNNSEPGANVNTGRRTRRSGKSTPAKEARRTVTAELTGGIDLLLDKREETSIYIIEQRN